MTRKGGVQRPTKDGTPGANTCLPGPPFLVPIFVHSPQRRQRLAKSTAAHPARGRRGDGWTHSDQLMMLPMTSSTMRSWREAETRAETRRRGGGPSTCGPHPTPPPPRPAPPRQSALLRPPPPPTGGRSETEEGPRSWAGTTQRGLRCTAGCSPCRARGGCDADPRVCENGRCSKAQAPFRPSSLRLRCRGPRAFGGTAVPRPHEFCAQ